MTDESAELQLRRLLNKALDDAWISGVEKGKIEGRQAGIEDAIGVIRSDDELTDEDKAELEAAIRAILLCGVRCDAYALSSEREMKARVRARVDLVRVMRCLRDHLAEYRAQGMADKVEAIDRVLSSFIGTSLCSNGRRDDEVSE